MRFAILLLVYAHIFILANPSFTKASESFPLDLDFVKGEIKKFSFHKDPPLIKNLLVLTEDKIKLDLMKKEHDFILVNFWATWCAPCIDEMPSLDKLQSLFDTENLKIITIATGRNSQKKITEFFNKNTLFNLENFIDPRGNLAIQLGILGLPGSILISPDGHELARLIGPINWVEPNVVKFFKNLTQ